MTVLPWALFIAFLWGLQPVLLKHLLKRFSWTTVLVVVVFVQALCVAGLGLYHSSSILTELQKFGYADMGIVAVAAVLTMFASSLVYYSILQQHASSVVAALVYTAPAFTLLLAYLLLHERITTPLMVGVALVVAGVSVIGYHEI